MTVTAGTTELTTPMGVAQPSGLERWKRATDAPLVVFAVGSLPILLLELNRAELTRGDRLLIDIVNVTVLVVFALDYVVELYLAADRRAYVRAEWMSLLIVIAQAMAVVPALAGFGVLRVYRGARAFRAFAMVVRIIALGRLATRGGRAVLRRRAGSIALGLAGLTWLTSAVAFTLVEDVGEGARIPSFFDALWWSTATITTVGYGDIYPVTAAGRVIGGVTMLVGISSFAIVTAKVAEFLVRPGGSTSTGVVNPQDIDPPV